MKNERIIFQNSFVFSVSNIADESFCQSSSCGINAVCHESKGKISCSCLTDYYGNPYESCRPECIISTDCPSNLICYRMTCQDPCPNACGINTMCQVINHIPVCSCKPDLSGDPFMGCDNLVITGSKLQPFDK